MITGLAFAEEASDYTSLVIPEGSKQVEISKISIPLAHKARVGLLFFEKLAGEKSFCVLNAEQASNLAGDGYKAIDGYKPILIKWSFLEPVKKEELDDVHAHQPTVYRKDDVLYVSSSGITIGDVGKVVEGVMIIQVPNEPKSVIFKLSKIGW